MSTPAPTTRDEPEPVLTSALEHYSYCPRQCALIHVERIFDENAFTLKGRVAHERADSGVPSWENGVRVERGLPIWSDRLGLQGKADAVEFHPDGRVYPVEYKSGARRPSRHDDIQLCAQALCLEEMPDTTVDRGAIYSIKTRRRRDVAIDVLLRARTVDTIAAVRRLLAASGSLPAAVNDGRCPHCSLLDACVPATIVVAREKRLARELFTIAED